MKKLVYTLSVLFLTAVSSFAQITTGRDTLVSLASGVSGTTRVEPISKQLIGRAESTVIIPEGHENWEENQKEALEYAISLWSGVIWYVNNIRIKVQFGSLPNNVLSEISVEKTMLPVSSNPEADHYFPDTYYPTALARRIDPDFESSSDGPYKALMRGLSATITYNNSNIWHFGNDENNVPNNKYDFVTAVLRDLAKVFGFYTDIAKTGSDLNPRYVNYNNPNYSIYDRLLTTSSTSLMGVPNSPPFNAALGAFATSDDVSIERLGVFSRTYKIHAPSVFKNGESLMYFDQQEIDNDNLLMQPQQKMGEAYHNIGIKTLNLLEMLGWYHVNIAIGFNSNPKVHLTSSDIYEGECLELSTAYVIDVVASDSDIASADTFDLRLIKKDGTLSDPLPVIVSNGITSCTVQVPSLIAGNNYSRDENGMIRAVVTATGMTFSFSTGYFGTFTSTFAIALPSEPETPTLRVKTVDDNFNYWESDVTIGFRSFKANYYLVKKRPIIGYSTASYGVSADNYEFTLPSVYMDMEHEITVVAYNDDGSTVSDAYLIGGDPDYYLNGGYNGSGGPSRSKAYRDPVTHEVISLDVAMNITSTANDLTLYFTKGQTEFVQLELTSVEIISAGTGSTITRLQNYSSGSAINTSHLPQGVYIVTATDDTGKVHRTKFVKK